MIDEQMLKAKFDKLSWKRAVTFDWTKLPDPMARRQLKLLVTNGKASLPDDKYNEVILFISGNSTTITVTFPIIYLYFEVILGKIIK